jgi:hypothetical protein
MNRWKNALFIANYVILRFFWARPNFSKIHKTEKKNFWPKQNITCPMILNDKPNWILMNPRPIFSNRS